MFARKIRYGNEQKEINIQFTIYKHGLGTIFEMSIDKATAGICDAVIEAWRLKVNAIFKDDFQIYYRIVETERDFLDFHHRSPMSRKMIPPINGPDATSANLASCW